MRIMELYNENLFDLLAAPPSNTSDDTELNLQIAPPKRAAGEGCSRLFSPVKGVTEWVFTTLEEALALVKRAEHTRILRHKRYRVVGTQSTRIVEIYVELPAPLEAKPIVATEIGSSIGGSVIVETDRQHNRRVEGGSNVLTRGKLTLIDTANTTEWDATT